MSSQEISGSAPPSSASSTTCQLMPFVWDEPKIVSVPCRILLDLILEDLHLPKAEYRLEFGEDGSIRMTILLKTSEFQTQDSPPNMWIHGIWSAEYREAEDSASMQVIRYLEKHAKVVIRDVNYARVQDLENQKKDMEYQLKSAQQCKEKFARGWFLAVRNMHSFSQQMRSIVLLNYSLEENPVDELWNTLLCNIADMGFRLQHVGLRLQQKLETMLNRS